MSSSLSALQVVYFSGNMAATMQIIGETLLKHKTTTNKRASPNTPFECEAPALFSSTVGCIGHRVKCVLIEPAGHSVHCVRNVWLPVVHRNPPALCSGGQSSSAMCVHWWGEGEGFSGVLTSVADSFLRASWHTVIPWMGIREHTVWAKHFTVMRIYFCKQWLYIYLDRCQYCRLSKMFWIYPLYK